MEKPRFGRRLRMIYFEFKKENDQENVSLPDISNLSMKNMLSKSNELQNNHSNSQTEPPILQNQNFSIKNEENSKNRESKFNKHYSEMFSSFHFLKRDSFFSILKKILKLYLIPHILAIIFAIFINFTNKIYSVNCFHSPECICDDIYKKVIYSIKEALFHWIIYIFVILYNPLYTKVFKIIFSLIQIVFYFMFFLLYPEKNFIRYPIYIELVICVLTTDFYIFRTLSFKQKIGKINQIYGCVTIHFANYILFSFLIPYIKGFLWDYAYEVLFSLYISVYFNAMEKSLIVLALYMEEDPRFSHMQKSLFQFNARISISFIIGFLASSFLAFKFENWSKYIVIVTYTNTLINFYTRFNIMQKILIYFWNLIFGKCKRITIKAENDPKKILIRKNISGYFLDVILTGSLRFLLYLALEDRIYYSDCDLILPEKFGIFNFFGINFLVTSSVIIYVIAKKIDFVRYQIYSNYFMNIYFLLLTLCLFEDNVLFFAHNS